MASVLKLMVCLMHMSLAWAMYSKRPLPDRAYMPPERRLRANLADLFLSNEVSGSRVASLFEDASVANPRHVKDLANLGMPKATRNLRRKLMKRSQWPELYYAPVRVYDKTVDGEITVQLPMLLPHELIGRLVEVGSVQALLSQEGLCLETLEHLKSVSRELGLNEKEVLPVGLWGDGVPFNWDRSESLEIVSINLPGSGGALRLPITAIPKKYVIKETTWDDVFSVVSWSFRCLLEGKYPHTSHDNKPFEAGDKKRSRLKGLSIGITGLLAEVRGDWAFFKETFRFPGWRENAGCCYRCRATKANIRCVGIDAPWRNTIMSFPDLLGRLLQQGLRMSTLFGCPGLKTTAFLIDWLHCSDLGVAQVFLGNLLWLLVTKKMPGATLKDKCHNLFTLMKGFYARTSPESRLDNLTLTMIKSSGKQPKLRGRAGEIRGLVAWGKELADQYLDDADPLESAVKEAADHLSKCYQCLSADVFSSPLLKHHSRKFLLLYVAIENNTTNPKLWRVKPKFHMWQHLCESGSRPSTCWAYRDEDFGGAMAKMGHRRGGRSTPTAVAERVLVCFMSRFRLPCIN